ncbi:MmgE/PrpD family protein [Halobacillus amylolyticus]|uniref:MmgE/PrpD family protein n=1 Tax=Halobacillus amylolyticus TaxID=2932259 RepID=A0ABY4HHC0_9BACI|nr:MmgE/PrpD family protein [Halobacillus amylolyticus]UOR13698.1 MmgE/PrpD family protein [Halobacillus amylolyticus]
METRTLVKNVLNTTYEEIPSSVVEHAKKSIQNWMGVAIGAAYHESMDMVLELKEDLNSGEQVSVLGRPEKVDLLLASLTNGMSSHIFDFDDTHLDTIHHPSGPIAPVVFALGEHYDLEPKELIRAFVLGCEVELRISNAVYPSHYSLGWHITSTAGVFGAAAAAGILLKFDEEQMLHALGLAGTQSSGLREMFGTMTKPFHPGKAAQNGLLAALLAKKGFTSSKQVLEAKRGFASVLAPEYNLDRINENWGTQWELLKNAFKPYACGIVLHPSIDACIKLRDYASVKDVKEIEVTVNPYVLELTGKPEPQTGLEGKFSIYHSATVGFLEGDAGEDQYKDEVVLRPDVVSFRSKVKPTVDPNMQEDEATAKLTLINGEEHTVKIEHATGSIENPMTQEHLDTKFSKLTQPIIGAENGKKVIEKVGNFENLSSIKEVIELCTSKNILV